jgi:cold shock CspA family protein
VQLQSSCVRVSCALAEKGYGFIAPADGPDVFVHYLEIDGYGFRSLEEGHQVASEETQGPRVGRPPVSAPYEQGTREEAVGRPAWCWHGSHRRTGAGTRPRLRSAARPRTQATRDS